MSENKGLSLKQGLAIGAGAALVAAAVAGAVADKKKTGTRRRDGRVLGDDGWGETR